MINADTLRSMRKGSILINHSRGDVVDLEALKKAIESGKLAGAAVDVFPEEPEKNGDAFYISPAGSAECNSNAARRRFDRRGTGKYRPRRDRKAYQISRIRHFARLAHRSAGELFRRKPERTASCTFTETFPASLAR